jgi:hypothetical protein
MPRAGILVVILHDLAIGLALLWLAFVCLMARRFRLSSRALRWVAQSPSAYTQRTNSVALSMAAVMCLALLVGLLPLWLVTRTR